MSASRAIDDGDGRAQGWAVVAYDPRRAVHVVPRYDGEPEHDADAACWCEPELHYVDPDTGGQVWTHRRMQ